MGAEAGTPRPGWHATPGNSVARIGLRRYLSVPRPDPDRGGRDADVFRDLPQRKCMNVERTRCGLSGRQAAADLREQFRERRTCGESLRVHKFTIVAMDGERWFETPNEPVRAHQKAAGQITVDRPLVDESLETLLRVNSARGIEHIPQIS